MHPPLFQTIRILLPGLLPLLVGAPLTMKGASGALDPSFHPVPGATSEIAAYDNGKILALGDYNGAADGSGVTLVRFNADGSADNSFAAPFNEFSVSFRHFVLQKDGKIVVGGGIPTGKSTGPLISRLLPDGALDSGFNLGVGLLANDFVVQSDGKVIANSRPSTGTGPLGFTTVFTRLNADGSLDTSYVTDGMLLSAVTTGLAIQKDDKAVALGIFTNYASGVGFSSSALIRLNSNASFDSNFQPPAQDPMTGGTDKLAIQKDGKFLASGVHYGNGSEAYLRRYNANGALDSSFNPTFAPAAGADLITRVEAILPQSNGKILVGGIFGSVNGVARTNLARLNADGSIDDTFVSPVEFQSGGNLQVLDLELQADGNLLVGGFLYQTLDARNLATTYGLVRVLNDAGGGGTTTPDKGADLKGKLKDATAKFKGVKSVVRALLTVHNAGNKKAKGVTAAIYLSDDSAFEADKDTFLDTVDLAEFGFGSLAKKASSTPVPLKLKVAGTSPLSGKYLLAVLDPTDAIAETDETNNVLSAGPLP